MVLVDTSVWVEHLRQGVSGLEFLLSDGEVVCHPFVIGELACGNLRNRREILSLLRELPALDAVGHEELLLFVEGHRLMGRGPGWSTSTCWRRRWSTAPRSGPGTGDCVTRRMDSGLRTPSRAALLLLLGSLAEGTAAAGAGHPPVAVHEGCVTRQCRARLLQPEPAVRGRSAHRPAADGDCASCHNLALTAGTHFVKGALAGGDGAGRADAWDLGLCAGCHDEALAAKDAPVGATGFVDGRKNLHALHVQAARGPRCLPCHDPHASPQAMLLRERIPARDGVVIPQEFRAR